MGEKTSGIFGWCALWGQMMMDAYFLSCGAPCRGRCPHRPAHFPKPFFSFSAEKEKNGFGLPRKERGPSAYRCPKFDSENLRLKLSVAPVPAVRKSAPLCSRLSEGWFQQNLKEKVALPVSEGPLFLWRLDTVSFSEGEKEMGSKRGGGSYGMGRQRVMSARVCEALVQSARQLAVKAATCSGQRPI